MNILIYNVLRKKIDALRNIAYQALNMYIHTHNFDNVTRNKHVESMET